MTEVEFQQLERYLTEVEREELAKLLAQDVAEAPWRPLPGPQAMAYESLADVIGYGGSAGGGKTALAVGKALMHAQRAAIFRREAPQLVGIIDYLAELNGGTRDGYSSRENIWRNVGPRKVTIELGSTPNLGDERKHQGRPKDLLVIDEATNMLEAQVRFLMGWVRSTIPGQRCQTLMTFNPPTDSEGRWVVSFFAPWLDNKHPLFPAKPGELLWVAVIQGKDNWDAPNDRRRFVLDEHGNRLYDFDPKDHAATDVITPQSRTFIPARLTDNPYLLGTGYMTTLQALPEPLRSQMLKGDFMAGISDSEWQVIPTEWVDAAMARWTDLNPKPPMDSLGADVARGGDDNNVLARRHGMWFDKPLVYPGRDHKTGPAVVGLIIAALRDHAVTHIDVIGIGASPYDFLVEANQDVVGVNVAEGSSARDKSGRLGFKNLRSELIWRMREALDPEANNGIALPPDPRLRADLCAYHWHPSGALIQVESREEVIKRIGRSPDWASAYILALMDTPKRWDVMQARQLRQRGEYDPFSAPGVQVGGARDYDPFSFN